MSLFGGPQSRANFSLTDIKSHDTRPPTITSSISTTSSSSDEGENEEDTNKIFPFLHLPLELRLKIYTYLLPPRTHTIVTTLPPTTYFYNSLPFPITSPSSTPSTYPFGHSAPLSPTGLPTPIHYKVLTNYPSSHIFPAILRTCKQIHLEAEPVLYAGKSVRWDFGVHLEALRTFWGERSAVARKVARRVRVAFEIPILGGEEYGVGEETKGRKAVVWERMVRYILAEMTGVREVDLTLWCADGAASAFLGLVATSSAPSAVSSEGDSQRLFGNNRVARRDVEMQWRKHPWTKTILSLPSLRSTKITVWTAMAPKREEGAEGVRARGFDSWVAGRMVGDGAVRKKMVREGVVREDVFTVRGWGT